MKKSHVRRLLSVIMCAMVCLSLCGCMRFKTTMEFTMNKKVNLSILYAMDYSSMNSMLGSETSSESSSAKEDESIAKMKTKLEEEGWKVKDYKDGEFKGFICTKKGISYDELSTNMTSSGDTMNLSSNPLTVKQDGGKVVLDWTVMSEQTSEQSTQMASFIEKMGGYVQLEIKVPGKAISHNAPAVSKDGRTLTWNLIDSNCPDAIHVEFTLINWTLILIVGGVVLLLVIAIVAVVIKKKNSF